METIQSSLVDLGDHAAPQGSVLGGLLFIINENDLPICREEGDSVLFVDDDTDVVSDADPEAMVAKIQQEANHSSDWLRDNRMCVAGSKSKLLVVATKGLRKNKLGRVLLITVDEKRVVETQSEKLLGVTMNNQMTWKEHLYGETWRVGNEKNNPGLIPQLSQRLGILRKISTISSKKTLRMLAQGLFYSKLNYCLPLFCNTWGLDKYKDGDTRSISFTKEDNRRLQVLQNQVDRQALQGRMNIPTKELLTLSGDLSVHQLGALRTLNLTKKILITRKPSHLARRLQLNKERVTRSGATIRETNTSLTLVREGFIYRGSSLYNMIPESMKKETNMEKFKKLSKAWVRENIEIKP